MKCDICQGEIDEHSHDGKVYWSQGHNAQPLSKGRCCDSCNGYVVGFRMFCITSKQFSKEKYELEKLRFIINAKIAKEEEE